jgi:ribosomal peptide maturation radical SAM protein 1
MQDRRVALVNMPFFTIYHPSIGLGLLKAALAQNGIICDVFYLNIYCAEWLGPFEYNQISHRLSSAYNAFMGEWLFSCDLFDRDISSRERYVHEILKERYERFFPQNYASRIFEIQDGLADFLSNCLVKTKWDQYDIVGFSSNFQQTTASLALAKRIKERFPNTVMILGGANCEGEMGRTLFRSFEFLDAVFSGEADETLLLFVRRLFSGGAIGPINGVFHRLDGAECIPDRMFAPVFDLDHLPYPNYDDYFEQMRASRLWPVVRGSNSPQVVVETSRGCWWGVKQHCTFCGLNGAVIQYRSKSSQRAIAELLYLHGRYQCFLQMIDNVLDLRYFNSLFPELVKRELGLRLFFETKVNLTKSQLRLLREAGVVAVQAGIESLSTDILRLMRKGSTALQNVQFLKWCKELDIEVGWNLIWGVPGENPFEYERMSAMVNNIQHLSPPMAINKLQLHRFSPYFVAREELGITNVRPHPSYFHIFPFSEEVISRLAYYFVFDYCDGRKPQPYANTLRRQLLHWQRTAGTYQLMYSDDGEVLTVKRVAESTSAVVQLRDSERKLYLFCDRTRALPSIVEFARCLAGREDSPGDLQGWLDQMVEHGLMLEDNQHYLSLAVHVPNSMVTPLAKQAHCEIIRSRDK